MNEHRAFESLLPWYANGTLNATDMARVETHLAGCVTCTQLLDSEMTLARSIQPSTIDEARFARLQHQRQQHFHTLRTLLSNQAQPLRLLQVKKRALARLTVVTAIFACLLLVWLLPALQNDTFEAMTRSQAKGATQVVVQVIPAAGLTKNDLNKLLGSIGATRLPANNDLGVVRLALENDKLLSQRLTTLREHTQLHWLGTEQ